MIADDGLRVEVADRHVVHTSSLAADRSVGSQTEQRLHGEASHDEKHVGANEKKLPAQIGCAAGHLGGRGIAVSRRAALEHVHDRDVAAALDADTLEHLREQLARLADERNALKVLLAAGRLAHERNAHPGTAFGEDDVLAAFGHRATGACACKPFKRRPVSLFTGGDNFGRKHECGRLRGA